MLQGKSAEDLARVLCIDGHDPDLVHYSCMVCGARICMDLRKSFPDLVESGVKFHLWEMTHKCCPVFPVVGRA